MRKVKKTEQNNKRVKNTIKTQKHNRLTTEQADRVEWNRVMIRTGTLCLASNKCQPTRLPGQSAPKCIQMIFEHLSLSFSRHKSCILKTARPPSLPLICFVNLSLRTLQAHSPSLVFCVHISIWWSSLLSETIDSFWFFLFFFFASLLPRHPPSFFSKVFLFREMIAPWDTVWQTGRQTEQVFFFPLPLSLSLSLTFD